MFVWSGFFFTQGIFSEVRCYILLSIVPQSAVYSSLLALQPYYEFVQGAKIADPFYVPTFNWRTLDTNYFLETAFTIKSYKLTFSFLLETQ